MKKQYTKVCQNPKCNKQFITEKSNQKYCSDECTKYMHNKQKRKKDSEKYKDKPCETCGKEHDHSYGTGRFCSKHCRMVHIANQSKHSPKKLAHLDKLHKLNKKPSGYWKCQDCDKTFHTKSELNEHKRECHGYKEVIKLQDNIYECPYCHERFNGRKRIIGHLTSCPNHPHKDYHDKVHKTQELVLHKKLLSGELDIDDIMSKQQNSCKSSSSKVRFRKDVKFYNISNCKNINYKVRGTWELNVAKELNRLNIEWDNKTFMEYLLNNKLHVYKPDFHISNSNIFIEVKGYYPDDDKKKMDAVLKSNPDVDIYFLHSNYERFLNSKMKLFQASTLLSESNVFDDNI